MASIRTKLRTLFIQPHTTQRVEELDAFRGFMVALMLLVNFSLYFSAVPGVFKHALPLRGVTVVDFGAPVFFFIIGITYALSLERRQAQEGARRTIAHFFKRYVTLWVFGLLGVWLTSVQFVMGWNVLMAIGAAGIVALPFMFLPPVWRFVAGLGLIALFEGFIAQHFLSTILAYDMGGYLGAIAWAGLIVISSVWWPVMKRNNLRQTIPLMALGVVFPTLIGFIDTSMIAANKPALSLPYLMYAYSLAVAALFLFHYLVQHARVKLSFFRPFGRNALVVYMFSGLLGFAADKLFPPSAPVLVVLVGIATIVTLCYALAYFLDQKRIFIKV